MSFLILTLILNMKKGEEKLTQKQMDRILSERTVLLDKCRNAPEGGEKVEFLGKSFTVFRNAYRPRSESVPLVKNFKIKKGETVLDACTGTGHIAIFAAEKGAEKVVAFDKSPFNVRSALENVSNHGMGARVQVREGDMFRCIDRKEMFDVIVCNPPFTNQPASDAVDSYVYDQNFRVHKELFAGAKKHLKPTGRMYITQANFGNINDMKKLAKKCGFSIKQIGEYQKPNHPSIFYAFELKRK